MTRSVPFVLLSMLVVCAPASAEEIRAGREVPLSVVRQGLASTAESRYVTTASNGKVVAAAWTDERGGQFMRLDPSGRRLDAISIALPFDPDVVFWRDDHWVIVDLTNGARFVRVDADGRLLDLVPRDTGFRVESNVYIRGMAWCGSAAIVVWTHQNIMYVQVLDQDLHPSGDPLILGRMGEWAEGVLSDGESAVVLFRDHTTAFDLRAASFDRYGQLQRSEVVHRSDEYVPTPIAMGSSNDGYIFVYPIDYRKPLYGGFRLTRDLDRRSIATFGTNEEPPYHRPVLSPTVSFDGTAWSAFFIAEDAEGVITAYATRISTAGKVLEANVPALTLKELSPNGIRAHGVAGSTIAFYDDLVTNLGRPYRLLKARAVPNGPETDLPIGAFSQTAWAAASSATQSLVAWREKTSQITELQTVFAARIDDRGNVLDPQSIPLASHSCNESLAVAGDGRGFLAAWDEPAGVTASIVRADGTTRPVRIRPADSCTAARILAASNGSSYLVAWVILDQKEQAYRVLAMRAAGDGTLLDEERVVIAEDAEEPFFLASDGRDFLITHGDRAVRIGGDGALLDRIPMRLNGVPRQVWWDGKAYAVVLIDEKTRDWRVRKIGSDGSGAFAFGELPPRAIELPVAARESRRAFHCDARGCATATLTASGTAPVERRAVPLRYTRVEDDGQSFAVRELPIAGSELPYQPVWFGPSRYDCGLTGASTPLLVCARPAFEEPYSHAVRLFVRPLFSGPRPRAVRH